MLKRDKECKGICLPRTYKLHSVGIRSPYLGFMWNGCSVSDAGLVHAHESAALGDVTSSLYPFGKSSTSPPSPENFGYVVHHLSLTRTPIRLCCGKRLMSGNPWVSGGGVSLARERQWDRTCRWRSCRPLLTEPGDHGTHLQKFGFAKVCILRTFTNNKKKFAKIRHTLCIHSKHYPVKMMPYCRCRHYRGFLSLS